MGKAEVLLVEDDLDLRNLLALYLSESSFDVTQAADGAEALRMLENSSKHFGALITDHNMPLLTGIELIQASIEKRIHVPVKILMSAESFREETIRALAEDHATMFLKKPILPSALLKILREFLQDQEVFIA